MLVQMADLRSLVQVCNRLRNTQECILVRGLASLAFKIALLGNRNRMLAVSVYKLTQPPVFETTAHMRTHTHTHNYQIQSKYGFQQPYIKQTKWECSHLRDGSLLPQCLWHMHTCCLDNHTRVVRWWWQRDSLLAPSPEQLPHYNSLCKMVDIILAVYNQFVCRDTWGESPRCGDDANIKWLSFQVILTEVTIW